MKPALHQFDGEQLTVREIMARVPCLGETVVRDHLKAGRNTKTAMLSFDSRAVSRANGRIGAKRGRAAGYLCQPYRRKPTTEQTMTSNRTTTA